MSREVNDFVSGILIVCFERRQQDGMKRTRLLVLHECLETMATVS